MDAAAVHSCGSRHCHQYDGDATPSRRRGSRRCSSRRACLFDLAVAQRVSGSETNE